MNLNRGAWRGLLFGVSLMVTLFVSSGWFLDPSVSQTVPQATPSAFAASSQQEMRGVWLTNIDSDVLFSQEKLSNGLERLSRLNFNTVYPTVWNWGYTLYPSKVAEAVIGEDLDPHPGLQGRDMLAEIVDQGHAQGMAVIPWFEFGLMAPSYSILAQRHPDWVTRRRNGTRIVMEGRHPRVWLNPLHPDVQQFILDLVTEIVTTYDVDGIQFDDHFGLPVDLGYDAYTVQQYQREHQGQSPPINPRDPEWVRWRANKITGLMTRIFYAVKSQKPDCLISLSPNPWIFSYQFYLQDWLTWERLGFVEELIVQIYRNDLERFVSELERPELIRAKHHIPVGVGVLVGLKDRPVEMQQIQTQVETVRDRQFAGVSFFFYETLGDRDDAFRSIFPDAVRRPRIPRIADPPPERRPARAP